MSLDTQEQDMQKEINWGNSLRFMDQDVLKRLTDT